MRQRGPLHLHQSVRIPRLHWIEHIVLLVRPRVACDDVLRLRFYHDAVPGDGFHGPGHAVH
eukprot:2143458-Prorocentrum_lima.AAC.1